MVIPADTSTINDAHIQYVTLSLVSSLERLLTRSDDDDGLGDVAIVDRTLHVN
jgi:hypothetical protein